MYELVSIHVPKTGGSSLVVALKQKYGRRLMHVSKPPISPLSRRLKIGYRQVRRAIKSWPARAIHGHVPASRYDGRTRQMITFVRDPVEQAISTYNYIRREHDRTGWLFNQDWIDATTLPLDAFLERPAPLLSRYVDVPPERFTFIGAMEHFDEDVRRLCRALDMSPVVAQRNVSPTPTRATSDQRRRFEAVNGEECAVFARTIERRAEILSQM